jgi:hypothetical protein
MRHQFAGRKLRSLSSVGVAHLRFRIMGELLVAVPIILLPRERKDDPPGSFEHPNYLVRTGQVKRRPTGVPDDTTANRIGR